MKGPLLQSSKRPFRRYFKRYRRRLPWPKLKRQKGNRARIGVLKATLTTRILVNTPIS